MSESAVRDKPLLVYGLARNRRSPKRLSEPRLSGVQPMEAEVGKRRRSLPLKSAGCLLGIESEHTGGTHGDSQSSTPGIFDRPDSQPAQITGYPIDVTGIKWLG